MALSTLGGSANTTARVEQEIFKQGRDLIGSAFRTLMFSALGMSILVLVVLIIDVFADGWPVLSTRPVSYTHLTLPTIYSV